MSHKVKKAVLPLAVLTLGAASAFLLASAREAPPRRPSRTDAPLVEAMEVAPREIQVQVRGQGTVQPRRRIQLVPQVEGQVISTHPQLAAGGYFRRGELLVAIDPRDYELEVERAEAAVARAQVRLSTEEAEAGVAREEWQRLHPGEEPPNPLVVREPQVRQAESELAAARAELAAARLDLERTRLTAPFDGRVESERVDAGQYLVKGQAVATVYATDVLEVPVPLEDRELAWFDAGSGAALDGDGAGSPAVVSVRFAGEGHRWSGRVVRSQGVDPATRMVTVVVAVEDGLDPAGRRPPLEPGLFVDVTIQGERLAEVFAIPRETLHGQEEVWVVRDGTLRVQAVEVARADREQAYVTAGLRPGDRIVTTALDAVTDGMAVRLAGEGGAAGATGEGGPPTAAGDGAGRAP